MSDYIPEGIQVDILKLLPAESLFRFRCVCKWWKQLIDSQPFIQDHLALQKKPRFIIEYEEHELLATDPSCLPPTFDTLLYPIRQERFHVVSTLHGIICLYDPNKRRFLLWNPCSIGKVLTVYNGSRQSWDESEGDYTFHDSGPNCGFWVNPCTKEFKILLFKLYDMMGEGNEVDVYSSVRGDWKELPVGEIETYQINRLATAVVIDGVGYWTAFYPYIEYTEDDGEEMNGVVVLSFDFVQEIFLDTIYALDLNADWDHPVLCSQNGTLSLVYMDPHKSCHIYLRKENSWVLVFGMDLLSDVSRILWGMGEGEGEDGQILAIRSGEMVLFDSKSMRYTLLRSGLKDSEDVVIANGFVESLLGIS